MARSRTYPLQSLLTLRRARLDDRAQALAERGRICDEATTRRQEAEHTAAHEAQDTLAIRGREAERLALGEARVSDLASLHAFRTARSVLQDELTNRVRASVAAQTTAEAAQTRARVELAHAHTETQLLEKHCARFQSEHTKVKLAVQEQEAEELYLSRNLGPCRE